ncbi:MAG: hypothetical protein WDM71_00920 [Ferruginibacter sp.]
MPHADSLCKGQSDTLSASGTYSYFWTPSVGLDNPYISNPIATPYNSTVYKVTGTDKAHCFVSTDSVDITVFNYPTISVGSNPTIPAGSAIVLSPTYSPDVTSWLWAPSKWLNSDHDSIVISTPDSTIAYTLTVLNNGGCSKSADISVLVPCAGRVFIPNTFFPADNNNKIKYFYPMGGRYSKSRINDNI